MNHTPLCFAVLTDDTHANLLHVGVCTVFSCSGELLKPSLLRHRCAITTICTRNHCRTDLFPLVVDDVGSHYHNNEDDDNHNHPHKDHGVSCA